jgi:hypothetical protein
VRGVNGSTIVGAPIKALTITEVDGCLNLYNEQTQRVVLLNETASAVWRLIDGIRDVDDITAQLADMYGVSVNDIRPDVQAALAQFRAEMLLAGGPEAGHAD